MAAILLQDQEAIRLVAKVNAMTTHVPVGGLVYANASYCQLMVDGDPGGIAYDIIIDQEADSYAAKAQAQPGQALGNILFINGFFVQAFGPSAGGSGGGTDWADITGKPATFPPTTGTTEGTALDGAATLDTIAGTVPVAKGGTGATTAAAGWTALGGGAVGKLATLPVASTTAAGVIQIGAAATQAMAGDKFAQGVAVANASSAASTAPVAIDPAADLPTTVAAVNEIVACLTAVRSNSGSSVTQLNALLASLRTGKQLAP